MNESGWYVAGGVIFGALAFVGAYLYCIVTYGLLLGGTVGFLASVIFAFFIGFLWPVVLIGIALVVGVILKNW